jgi:hypothetical protein
MADRLATIKALKRAGAIDITLGDNGEVVRVAFQPGYPAPRRSRAPRVSSAAVRDFEARQMPLPDPIAHLVSDGAMPDLSGEAIDG